MDAFRNSIYLSLHEFIHVIKISTMIVAVFITHPASESFFVSSRSFLAIMPLQSIVISETFTTWFTFLRWIRMEFSFVIKQCLFPGETFLTLGALEGFFSTVYPQMVLQGTWASETFFAPSCIWRAFHKYVLTSVFSNLMTIWAVEHLSHWVHL